MHALSAPRLFVAQLACKNAARASSTWMRGERCEDGGVRGRAGLGTSEVHVPCEAHDCLVLFDTIWTPNGWAMTRQAGGVESWPERG